MIAATLLAAFVAGLAGSLHCFGMCGGIASAFGMRARLSSASRLRGSLLGSLYHVGRICGYAAIGGVFGAFGHSVHWLLALTRFESGLRIATAVLMFMISMRVLTRRNPFAPVERVGARLWVGVRPLTQCLTRVHGPFGTFLSGLLWGFMPCGLVYSAMLLALTTGSALTGAVVMFVFGIATLPALVASTLIVANSLAFDHPRLRMASGVLLLAFAAWTLVSPRLMSHDTHDAHSVAMTQHSAARSE